jgi:hypothetical protein
MLYGHKLTNVYTKAYSTQQHTASHKSLSFVPTPIELINLLITPIAVDNCCDRHDPRCDEPYYYNEAINSVTLT